MKSGSPLSQTDSGEFCFESSGTCTFGDDFFELDADFDFARSCLGLHKSLATICHEIVYIKYYFIHGRNTQ